MKPRRWVRGIETSPLALLVLAVAGACSTGADDATSDQRLDDDSLLGSFDGVVLEEGVPRDAHELFQRANSWGLAAPCVLEPDQESLFPRNWMPARFRWSTAAAANLFEIRIRSTRLPADVFVYTAGWSWTMPVNLWTTLQGGDAETAVTVELRAALYDRRGIRDVTSAALLHLAIAPVEAPGNIVYWSIRDTREESRLRGMTMASDTVFDVLSSFDMPANGTEERGCIGCHTATPDGKDVAIAWEHRSGGFSSDLARIEKGARPGGRPDYLSAPASSTLAKRTRMFSAFSRAHFQPGDRLMLTNDGGDLVWVDLEASSEAAATGILGKEGDPNERRLAPTWSRDGESVVYMSGPLATVPSDLKGPSDLYTMPFAARAGATAASPAKPIVGAAEPERAEYYPAFSPDDTLIAFNAIPDNGRLYDNPASEIFVVPREGGDAIRLRANDPPACSGKTSPGIGNSWAKWAPAVQERGGKRYSFIVFSSRRHLFTGKPQLYVAPIVVEPGGRIVSYPALHLRQQEGLLGWEGWGNHTPAWDDFVIEPPPVVK